MKQPGGHFLTSFSPYFQHKRYTKSSCSSGYGFQPTDFHYARRFSIGIWRILGLGYTTGGLQLEKFWAGAANSQPALHAAGFAKDLNTSYAVNWVWTGVGMLATFGMMAARARLTWFPLHPLGLIMCLPFAMHSMWLSIFLGWTAKVLITRFGGTDTYRRAIPFFLGITLGSITMVVFWVAIDAWQGMTRHQLLPF